MKVVSGTRTGHIEKSTFLDQNVGRYCAGSQTIGRELVRVERGSPQPKIGPPAILDTYDPNLIPFQTLGAVSGEDAHGIVMNVSLAHCLRGDLLLLEYVEEHARSKKTRVPTAETFG